MKDRGIELHLCRCHVDSGGPPMYDLSFGGGGLFSFSPKTRLLRSTVRWELDGAIDRHSTAAALVSIAGLVLR